MLLIAPGVTLANTDAHCLQIETLFATNKIEALNKQIYETPRAIAHQSFRLAAAYIPADEKQLAIGAIRQGLKAIEKGLENNPEDVDLLLLGAMLDGQWLLINRWRFFFNGRRGLQRLSKAEGLNANHPHVTLLRGTAKIILPRILGGNRGEARNMFETALNHHDTTGVPFRKSKLCVNINGVPIWGQVDLLNWLGRAHAGLDQPHEANFLLNNNNLKIIFNFGNLFFGFYWKFVSKKKNFI